MNVNKSILAKSKCFFFNICVFAVLCHRHFPCHIFFHSQIRCRQLQPQCLYLFAYSTKVTYLALPHFVIWLIPWNLSFCYIPFHEANSFSDINRKCILPIMVMSDKTTSDIIRTYIFNLFHSVLKGLTCQLKAIENPSPKLPH